MVVASIPPLCLLSLLLIGLLSIVYEWVWQQISKENYFVARNISRFPPGGPGRRSTVNPAVCSILLTTPLAQ